MENSVLTKNTKNGVREVFSKILFEIYESKGMFKSGKCDVLVVENYFSSQFDTNSILSYLVNCEAITISKNQIYLHKKVQSLVSKLNKFIPSKKKLRNVPSHDLGSNFNEFLNSREMKPYRKLFALFLNDLNLFSIGSTKRSKWWKKTLRDKYIVSSFNSNNSSLMFYYLFNESYAKEIFTNYIIENGVSLLENVQQSYLIPFAQSIIDKNKNLISKNISKKEEPLEENQTKRSSPLYLGASIANIQETMFYLLKESYDVEQQKITKLQFPKSYFENSRISLLLDKSVIENLDDKSFSFTDNFMLFCNNFSKLFSEHNLFLNAKSDNDLWNGLNNDLNSFIAQLDSTFLNFVNFVETYFEVFSKNNSNIYSFKSFGESNSFLFFNYLLIKNKAILEFREYIKTKRTISSIDDLDDSYWIPNAQNLIDKINLELIEPPFEFVRRVQLMMFHLFTKSYDYNNKALIKTNISGEISDSNILNYLNQIQVIDIEENSFSLNNDFIQFISYLHSLNFHENQIKYSEELQDLNKNYPSYVDFFIKFLRVFSSKAQRSKFQFEEFAVSRSYLIFYFIIDENYATPIFENAIRDLFNRYGEVLLSDLDYQLLIPNEDISIQDILEPTTSQNEGEIFEVEEPPLKVPKFLEELTSSENGSPQESIDSEAEIPQVEEPYLNDDSQDDLKNNSEFDLKLIQRTLFLILQRHFEKDLKLNANVEVSNQSLNVEVLKYLTRFGVLDMKSNLNVSLSENFVIFANYCNDIISREYQNIQEDSNVRKKCNVALSNYLNNLDSSFDNLKEFTEKVLNLFSKLDENSYEFTNFNPRISYLVFCFIFSKISAINIYNERFNVVTKNGTINLPEEYWIPQTVIENEVIDEVEKTNVPSENDPSNISDGNSLEEPVIENPENSPVNESTDLSGDKNGVSELDDLNFNIEEVQFLFFNILKYSFDIENNILTSKTIDLKNYDSNLIQHLISYNLIVNEGGNSFALSSDFLKFREFINSKSNSIVNNCRTRHEFDLKIQELNQFLSSMFEDKNFKIFMLFIKKYLGFITQQIPDTNVSFNHFNENSSYLMFYYTFYSSYAIGEFNDYINQAVRVNGERMYSNVDINNISDKWYIPHERYLVNKFKVQETMFKVLNHSYSLNSNHLEKEFFSIKNLNIEREIIDLLIKHSIVESHLMSGFTLTSRFIEFSNWFKTEFQKIPQNNNQEFYQFFTKLVSIMKSNYEEIFNFYINYLEVFYLNVNENLFKLSSVTPTNSYLMYHYLFDQNHSIQILQQYIKAQNILEVSQIENRYYLPIAQNILDGNLDLSSFETREPNSENPEDSNGEDNLEEDESSTIEEEKDSHSPQQNLDPSSGDSIEEPSFKVDEVQKLLFKLFKQSHVEGGNREDFALIQNNINLAEFDMNIISYLISNGLIQKVNSQEFSLTSIFLNFQSALELVFKDLLGKDGDELETIVNITLNDMNEKFPTIMKVIMRYFGVFSSNKLPSEEISYFIPEFDTNYSYLLFVYLFEKEFAKHEFKKMAIENNLTIESEIPDRWFIPGYGNLLKSIIQQEPTPVEENSGSKQSDLGTEENLVSPHPDLENSQKPEVTDPRDSINNGDGDLGGSISSLPFEIDEVQNVFFNILKESYKDSDQLLAQRIDFNSITSNSNLIDYLVNINIIRKRAFSDHLGALTKEFIAFNDFFKTEFNNGHYNQDNNFNFTQLMQQLSEKNSNIFSFYYYYLGLFDFDDANHIFNLHSFDSRRSYLIFSFLFDKKYSIPYLQKYIQENNITEISQIEDRYYLPIAQNLILQNNGNSQIEEPSLGDDSNLENPPQSPKPHVLNDPLAPEDLASNDLSNQDVSQLNIDILQKLVFEILKKSYNRNPSKQWTNLEKIEINVAQEDLNSNSLQYLVQKRIIEINSNGPSIMLSDSFIEYRNLFKHMIKSFLHVDFESTRLRVNKIVNAPKSLKFVGYKKFGFDVLKLFEIVSPQEFNLLEFSADRTYLMFYFYTDQLHAEAIFTEYIKSLIENNNEINSIDEIDKRLQIPTGQKIIDELLKLENKSGGVQDSSENPSTPSVGPATPPPMNPSASPVGPATPPPMNSSAPPVGLATKNISSQEGGPWNSSNYNLNDCSELIIQLLQEEKTHSLKIPDLNSKINVLNPAFTPQIIGQSIEDLIQQGRIYRGVSSDGKNSYVALVTQDLAVATPSKKWWKMPLAIIAILLPIGILAWLFGDEIMQYIQDLLNDLCSPPTAPVAPTLPIYPVGGGVSLIADYTIVSGDNLWNIVEAKLPAGASDLEILNKVNELYNFNSSTLRSGDPDLIYPGETLRFPPGF